MSEPVKRYSFKGAAGLYVYEVDFDAMAQRCAELEAENGKLSAECDQWARDFCETRKERDTLRGEVERLQAKLRRIEAVAQCGSVQSWLALPDDAKAQWFAMHLEMDDERRADAARLQWLADNMRLMSGYKNRVFGLGCCSTLPEYPSVK